MKVYSKNQAGFIHVISIFIVAIIVLIGLSGWYVWSRNRDNSSQSTNISSYEECVAAGYPVMESYPVQCTVPDGETFVRELTGDEQELDEIYQDDEEESSTNSTRPVNPQPSTPPNPCRNPTVDHHHHTCSFDITEIPKLVHVKVSIVGPQPIENQTLFWFDTYQNVACVRHDGLFEPPCTFSDTTTREFRSYQNFDITVHAPSNFSLKASNFLRPKQCSGTRSITQCSFGAVQYAFSGFDASVVPGQNFGVTYTYKFHCFWSNDPDYVSTAYPYEGNECS